MKKFVLSAVFALLLTAVLSAGLFASAEVFSGNCGATSGDSVSYTLDTASGVMTISGNGQMAGNTTVSVVPWDEKRVYITKLVIQNGVTNVGRYAFSDCEVLSEITLPASIKKIDSDAFRGCGALKSLVFPEGLESIGSSAFYDCYNLDGFTIPQSVSYIGGGAFHNTAFINRAEFRREKFICLDNCLILAQNVSGEVSVPDGIRLIADSAFSRCFNIASVNVGSGVLHIGDNSFTYSKMLTDINIAAENPNYLSTNGVLFNKNKTKLIQYPMGKTEKSYNVPASVNEIAYYAFYGFFGKKDFTLCGAENGPAKAYAQKLQMVYAPLPSPGDIVNKYLHTDIKAKIGSKGIRSYNIDGNTAIIAEDLASYGFKVDWNGATRSLSISEGDKIVVGGFEGSASGGMVGTPAGNVLYTDIVTYVAGKQVTSYNIGGMTAIILDDLAAFGKINWDGTTRTITFER